jgi:hypothetical protein
LRNIHKTVLNEFYRVAFRKRVYHSIDELQADLDVWLTYNGASRVAAGRASGVQEVRAGRGGPVAVTVAPP